jgi:hypothetical protein
MRSFDDSHWGGGREFATKVQQGRHRLLRGVRGHHLADEDRVIAAQVREIYGAFEVRRGFRKKRYINDRRLSSRNLELLELVAIRS